MEYENEEDFDKWYKSLSKVERKKFDAEVKELDDFLDEQYDGGEIIGFRD